MALEMGGAGLAAEDSGNIFISTGNEPYDGIAAFGESVLKFDSQLHLLNHFTPNDFNYMDWPTRTWSPAASFLFLFPVSAKRWPAERRERFICSTRRRWLVCKRMMLVPRRPSGSNPPFHRPPHNLARTAGERGQQISIPMKSSGRPQHSTAQCIWE